jgi:hypothetical protein
MPIVEIKVFEQYEYHDYLITIQDYCGGPELEAIAVPTKYAHLFNDMHDVYNCCEIFDDNGIEHQENIWAEEDQVFYERDLIPLVAFDPNDTIVWLEGVKTDNSTSVLNFVVNELNWLLELNPKTIVLKQIYKKSVTPKTSKNKRGFNQVAWASMVKLRDGKCTQCGSVYDLHAHHIKSYKDNEALRFDVNNGVTLCGQCHREYHKIHGK